MEHETFDVAEENDMIDICKWVKENIDMYTKEKKSEMTFSLRLHNDIAEPLDLPYLVLSQSSPFIGNVSKSYTRYFFCDIDVITEYSVTVTSVKKYKDKDTETKRLSTMLKLLPKQMKEDYAQMSDAMQELFENQLVSNNSTECVTNSYKLPKKI